MDKKWIKVPDKELRDVVGGQPPAVPWGYKNRGDLISSYAKTNHGPGFGQLVATLKAGGISDQPFPASP